LIPDLYLMSLEEAVDAYRQLLEVDRGSTIQAGLAPGTIWSPNWFPLLRGYGNDYIVMILQGADVEGGGIMTLDLEFPEGNRILASSLAEFLSQIAQRYESGDYLVADGVVGHRRPGEDVEVPVLSPETRQLLEQIQSPDGTARGVAAAELIATRDPPAVPVLIGLLSHRSPGVRSSVVRVLGEIASPDAASRLWPLLEDPHWGVRTDVANALFALGNPAAAPALRGSLDDSNLTVKLAVIAALGEVGDEGDLARLAAIHDNPAAEQVAQRAMIRIQKRLAKNRP
jgi:hypothetical protein